MEELSQNISGVEQVKTALPGKPFVKGVSGNPKGRPKKTEIQKAIDREVTKTVKDYLADYEQGLAEALPNISPALIAQAEKGNVKAFAEIHKVLGAHKPTNAAIAAVQINFTDDRKEYE